MELNHNKGLKKYTENSIIVKTRYYESVFLITHTLEVLGVLDIKVKRLSVKRFVLILPEEIIMVDLDINFLALGLLKTWAAKQNGLIVPRQVWLEIRGLPISSWGESNFFRIIGDKGIIYDVPSVLKDEDSIRNPRVMIETQLLDTLDWSLKVILQDKIYDIKLLKCEREIALNDLEERCKEILSPPLANL